MLLTVLQPTVSGLADVTQRRRFSECVKSHLINVFLIQILSGNGNGELPILENQATDCLGVYLTLVCTVY